MAALAYQAITLAATAVQVAAVGRIHLRQRVLVVQMVQMVVTVYTVKEPGKQLRPDILVM
jgi:hypothetical protein